MISRHRRRRPRGVTEGLWAALTKHFNDQQLVAIERTAIGSPTGCTLVQGPPGTGKTNVVLGILSVLLAGALPLPPSCFSSDDALGGGSSASSGKSSGGKTLAKAGSGSAAETQKALPRKKVLPPNEQADSGRRVDDLRILVCAPTNRALDELLQRLWSQGLWGAKGEKFGPSEGLSVVRLGHRESAENTFFLNNASSSSGAFGENSYDNDGRISSSNSSSTGGSGSGGGSSGGTIDCTADDAVEDNCDDMRREDEAQKTLLPMREVYEMTSLDAMVRARPQQHERAVRLAALRNAHIVATTLSGAGSQVCVAGLHS